MSKAYFLVGLLLLSGCASWFVEQPKGPWAELKQQSRQCLRGLEYDRELRGIADKVTLGSLYDRDEYFELLSIKDRPTAKEKIIIKKWAAKLELCYKIKAASYAYEPPGVAKWSAAADSEQLMLVFELSRGNLRYGEFAAKRLDIDTIYRGQITRAIAADYKTPGSSPQPTNNVLPKTPSASNSSCGWEGNLWVCRSL
jgi:hypothetical protein